MNKFTIALALLTAPLYASVTTQGSGPGTRVTITVHVANPDGEDLAEMLLIGYNQIPDNCPGVDATCRAAGIYTGTDGEILCGGAQDVANGLTNYVGAVRAAGSAAEAAVLDDPPPVVGSP